MYCTLHERFSVRQLVKSATVVRERSRVCGRGACGCAGQGSQVRRNCLRASQLVATGAASVTTHHGRVPGGGELERGGSALGLRGSVSLDLSGV